MKAVFVLSFIASLLAVGQGLSSRLANGQPATQLVPYHVHLLISNTAIPDSVSIGSGVLISRTVVLTVGFNIAKFNSWEGGVGSLNYTDLIYFHATGAILHENYNADNSANNIGCIIFGAGIDAPGVSPTVLPSFGSTVPSPGDTGSIAGFGFTSSELNEQADVLQVGTQMVLTRSICQQEFPELGAVLDSLFCGINVVTQVTPCGGEQGSGFSIQQGGQTVVVGLMSLTRNACEAPIATTFYVQISEFRLWILQTIGV